MLSQYILGLGKYKIRHQLKHLYYNLKHLVMFTKCTNLCNTIELYMKNDFPIVIKFQVGSLGTLKLAIAPKLKD